MNTKTLLALAAFAAVAALPAHADEADGSQYPLTFTSTRSAADVRVEAMNPQRVSNGGTGFIGLTKSTVSVQAVREEAIQSARRGETARGEMGPS